MKLTMITIGIMAAALLAACSEGVQDPAVKIVEEFPEKIIYDYQQDSDVLTQDCRERGGQFNECGSACAPDAEICTLQCAPVCELSPENETEAGIDDTNLGLTVAADFRISEFVTDVSGARVLAGPDALGNFWLSRTDAGIVSLIEVAEGNTATTVSDIFVGLNNPHGLALDPQDGTILYIAEEDKISRVKLYTEGEMEKIADLPRGGRHFTRSLLFGPDDRLYVSIGSSCDTCVEEDERYASIYVMEKDGSNFKQHASGLRNAVFMTIDPVDGRMWTTEMGRDFLGDDLPPDEVNVIEEGEDYGWPYCYGNQIRDREFEGENNLDYCDNTVAAKIELQAHSAPLGLAFIPEEGWPEDMWLDLVVAYHGSWNRSEPTGYKLMQFELDDERKLVGRKEFVSGWLADGDKLGRPVDVLTVPGGVMYVTDDKRGVVYKIEYLRQN